MKVKRKKIPEVITYEHLIASIYHIIFIGNTTREICENMLEVAEKMNNKEKRMIRFLSQSKTLIDTISLIDELGNYLFRYNSEDIKVKSKIDSYNHIIQPALDQIHSWKDMRAFRHNVLAHSFRIDRNGFESVHLANKLHGYNIPESTIDLEKLFKLINVITKVAEDIFFDEYQEAKKIIENHDKSKGKVIQSIDDEVEKINEVLREVNKRIEDYNSTVK